MTPCHTTGHTCFLMEGKSKQKIVFTGDFLFMGGTGKFFEGDAKMKYESIQNFLTHVDDQTLLFYGHEYASDTLKYLSYIDPSNDQIQDQLKFATK